jgi:hypothetical protein
MTARRTETERDPVLEAAREEAEGVEVFESPVPEEAIALAESEAAQGVESFDNPDAVISPAAAREGKPGHEMLTGEQAGLDWANDDYRPDEERSED